MRRWPNIKTTLDRRFVFAVMTTVSVFFKFRNVAFINYLLAQVRYLFVTRGNRCNLRGTLRVDGVLNFGIAVL